MNPLLNKTILTNDGQTGTIKRVNGDRIKIYTAKGVRTISHFDIKRYLN